MCEHKWLHAPRGVCGVCGVCDHTHRKQLATGAVRGTVHLCINTVYASVLLFCQCECVHFVDRPSSGPSLPLCLPLTMATAARSPCVHRSNVRSALFGRQCRKTPKVLQSFRPCGAAPEATQEDAPSNTAAEQPEYGRQTYQPESYNEMLGDAAKAMARALENGETRMEIEFPAVPTTDCAFLGPSCDSLVCSTSSGPTTPRTNIVEQF